MADELIVQRIAEVKKDIAMLMDRVDLLHGEARSVLRQSGQLITALAEKNKELVKLLEGVKNEQEN